MTNIIIESDGEIFEQLGLSEKLTLLRERREKSKEFDL
jgi:hypothetical protein